jgi:hypothetical protein
MCQFHGEVSTILSIRATEREKGMGLVLKEWELGVHLGAKPLTSISTVVLIDQYPSNLPI